MKKINIVMTFAIALLLSSCAMKKDLAACQEENKALQTNYVDTKEKLAAANVRVASLEEQLKRQEQAVSALQQSLDKSLSNAN